MPARLVIAAERIAEDKILYEQTDTSVLDICARMGISRNALYARIDDWKWQRRRYTSGSAAAAEASEALPWKPSRGRLKWKNGAVAQVFTAENYERLRGPQFSAAWLDELAKWRQVRAL